MNQPPVTGSGDRCEFIEGTYALFDRLAEMAFAELRPNEELTLDLAAEDQAYLRFNASRVRQATAVTQRHLTLTFQAGGRRVVYGFDLGGEADDAVLRSLLARARAEAAVLPEDPFLVPMENHGCSDYYHPGRLPDPAEVIERIATITADTDFTGCLASGPQLRANRNSAGQNHRFASLSFFLDYSLFTVNADGDNKAVKGLYADRQWDDGRFETTLLAQRARLEPLRRAPHPLPPGSYRVYLAPAAVAELAGMFAWGALSYGAWKKGESALQRLIEGEVALSEAFTLVENFALGLSPPFNSLGEVAPIRLPLIERGKLANLLVSSRSAKEYGAAANGAEPEGWNGEFPRSPAIEPGLLAEAEALKALGSGLYLGNLHYLNWSDRLEARVTGMTRYACFWVERGEIVAPIRDLRFDESLYRIFGSELEALTRETELRVNTDTYGRRSLGGCQVPGAVVGQFRFTL
ncbi:TldD/PmbA family protein [Candidatus Methylocalor cossyra]|uniref:TldE/PmbA family protein, Beta/Gamma-proteobacterial subgroup n=1 Tax=Candidatus Methylocalor cossyra TaxID=3108543 RepID=A0ABP1C481_9GAMM